MSALSEMLAAQDEAALLALASAGLLRRARAGVAAAEILEIGAGQARLRVEGQMVALTAEGPSRARCDCPATGICRHILTAVLALRARDNSPQASGPTACEEIAALGIDEIEAFAGADWAQALRLAARADLVALEDCGASCVVRHDETRDRVTFVAGGGLRGALFKGGDARRRRFVAAAALIVAGHRIAAEDVPQHSVAPELLTSVAAAVQAAVYHAARGDPALAQDRLFDLAVSSRAEAAPRLAGLLRHAARQAGLLARHDPQADRVAFLATLAEAHALQKALERAPADPALTGQMRRDFQEVAPMDVAILGAGSWRAASGARGLSLHGWDGAQFLTSGPARAAGADPGFAPEQSFDLAWWQGLTPAKLTGRCWHLPRPRLSSDGVLPGQLVAQDRGAIQLGALPLHDDWQGLRADVVARLGIGLRAATRPVPALIRFASVATPRFDGIEQCDMLDLSDGRGGILAVRLPGFASARAIFEGQGQVRGALIETIPETEGIRWRLLSLYLGDPVRVWNVTIDDPPEALKARGHVDRLRQKGVGDAANPFAATPTGKIVHFTGKVLRSLSDAPRADRDDTLWMVLAQEAEALGLTRLAAGLIERPMQRPEAVLVVAWQALLIRRTALHR